MAASEDIMFLFTDSTAKKNQPNKKPTPILGTYSIQILAFGFSACD